MDRERRQGREGGWEREREKRERGRDDVDRKDKTWGKEDKRGGERERERRDLCVDKVVSPQRSDLILTTHVPHSEANVLVFYCFHVES